jgi:Zn-dependent protease/CBS domain-containing protein
MGIDITVDASWFIIVALLIYTLGFVEFPHELRPRASAPRADATSIVLGVAASLLLFASVLAHELAHSWMAIQRGILVKRITLFIFGGVAQITDEPDRPSSEFLIAIVGPLMSAALALVFGAAWLWLTILDSTAVAGRWLTAPIVLMSVLAQANGSLALFNLAPGFPLDGGRVLRAILWGMAGDIRRATRWATRAGQFIALVMIGIGGALFFFWSNSGGLWYALIGVFLWSAASEGYRQMLMLQTLRGVSVRQLMTRVVETVPPDISLIEFVDTYLLPRREQTFVVSDGIAALGSIAFDQIKRVQRAEWSTRRVREVMTPRSNLQVLAPEQSAASALARLSASEQEELPVMEGEQVVGFVGQGALARYLRLKAQ